MLSFPSLAAVAEAEAEAGAEAAEACNAQYPRPKRGLLQPANAQFACVVFVPPPHFFPSDVAVDAAVAMALVVPIPVPTPVVTAGVGCDDSFGVAPAYPPGLLFAAIAVGLSRRTAKQARWLTVALLVATLVGYRLFSFAPLGGRYDPAYYQLTNHNRRAAEVVSSIPKDRRTYITHNDPTNPFWNYSPGACYRTKHNRQISLPYRGLL